MKIYFALILFDAPKGNKPQVAPAECLEMDLKYLQSRVDGASVAKKVDATSEWLQLACENGFPCCGGWN